VFDKRKGWPHLRRDLAVIATLQLAALIYGLNTVYVARPVATVFEVDRFRVIAAADVYLPELETARPEYRRLPITGPWLLGTRAAMNADERNDALFKGLGGIDIGQRPKYWQPYADSKKEAAAKARPIDILLKRYPLREAEFRASLLEMNANTATTRFLPLVARGDWVILLDASGNILGHIRADGFF
jgi:hypothetical protein